MVSRAKVYDCLQEIFDPEVGINIVDLGLVYDVAVEQDNVAVDFTLTYRGCPLGPQIQQSIIDSLTTSGATAHATANLVWEPRWDPSFMSDEARVSLGYPI